MSYKRKEIIGDCTLYLGDCMDILPTLGKVDHIITDPPYAERTHAGHDAGARSGSDGASRSGLGYGALSRADVSALANNFVGVCDGWIVWMCDHHLAAHIQPDLEALGRYVFAPLPYFAPGSRVRMAGDGPSSWTIWIVVARTAAQHRWGTLPGGYVAGEGWREREHMGGKPTQLMTRLVEDYSRHGDTVCDPFLGSGTTGVACVQLGRKFIGIEIDESYFDIACERISRAEKQPDMFIQPKPEQAKLL